MPALARLWATTPRSAWRHSSSCRGGTPRTQERDRVFPLCSHNAHASPERGTAEGRLRRPEGVPGTGLEPVRPKGQRGLSQLTGVPPRAAPDRNWPFWQVSALLACWSVPQITGRSHHVRSHSGPTSASEWRPKQPSCRRPANGRVADALGTRAVVYRQPGHRERWDPVSGAGSPDPQSRQVLPVRLPAAGNLSALPRAHPGFCARVAVMVAVIHELRGERARTRSPIQPWRRARTGQRGLLLRPA